MKLIVGYRRVASSRRGLAYKGDMIDRQYIVWDMTFGY
jgi:hypothetical protein